LNSINTNIDFAFYTIALTNSAINVKVWIYKGEKSFDWHLNII
jgi:ribosomal protein S3